MFFFNPLTHASLATQSALLLFEAQAVMAMRFMGMAGVWSVAPSENTLMVTEKMQATTRAILAANRAALSGGSPERIASALVRPVRQKTKTNTRRLGKRGLKTIA